MKTITYLGYTIIYFPEAFKEGGIEDLTTSITISKDGKILSKLNFSVPWRDRLVSNKGPEALSELALAKVRTLIDEGIAKNNYNEFEFISSNFEGVVEVNDKG